MQSLVIDITITADEYIKRYQFPGAVVVTRSRDGRSVRFPANILQPYVTHSGISGTYRISFDAAGKFSRIEEV